MVRRAKIWGSLDLRRGGLLFAGEETDAWAKELDDVVSSLVAGLAERPVDVEMVEGVMTRARVFVQPDTSA
ncbi:MAG: hypothetical protein KUG77_02555 [Nannocystaceae bacterium]|nr:hypothetical protein [Nannocystaceae bacterium]